MQELSGCKAIGNYVKGCRWWNPGVANAHVKQIRWVELLGEGWEAGSNTEYGAEAQFMLIVSGKDWIGNKYIAESPGY